jgi:hypothetical protein
MAFPRLETADWFDSLSGDWRVWMAVSTTVDDAVDALAHEHRHKLDDPDNEFQIATFWLSLAVYMWRDGCLTAGVKRRALGIIRKGEGLDGGESEAWRVRARAREFEKVRVLMETPQPPMRSVKPRTLTACPLPLGSVVVVRAKAIPIAALHVCEIVRDRWAWLPVCTVRRWTRDGVPTAKELLAAKPLGMSMRDRDPILADILQSMGGRRSARPELVSAMLRGFGKTLPAVPGVDVYPAVTKRAADTSPNGRFVWDWSDLPRAVGECLRRAK